MCEGPASRRCVTLPCLFPTHACNKQAKYYIGLRKGWRGWRAIHWAARSSESMLAHDVAWPSPSDDTTGAATPITPIGFLDTERCHGIDASLIHVLSEAAIPNVVDEHGNPLDRAALEALMGATYTSRLIFERECDLKGMDTWAMPPPVSPAIPFGRLPSSSKLGIAAQLHAGSSAPGLCVRRVGVVAGVDCGLGLFASLPRASGSYVAEYTGVVRVDPDARERDDYAFGLPVCDPDVRISAKRFGSICRLLNHSDVPNTAFECVVHQGIIHLVARTCVAVQPGEQLLVDYGPGYWRSHGRGDSKVVL
jgi:hypothetical protein